jgi:anti-anti-sigma factor
MPIMITKDPGFFRIEFNGRLDTLASNSVEQEINNAFAEIDNTDLPELKIIFDLAKVDFVSSAFMRVCLKYAKKVAQGNLELINTDLKIKKTFKIAGLDKVLKII